MSDDDLLTAKDGHGLTCDDYLELQAEMTALKLAVFYEEQAMYLDRGRAELIADEASPELLRRFELSADLYRRCVETALWTSPEAQRERSIDDGLRRTKRLAEKSCADMERDLAVFGQSAPKEGE